MTTTPLASLQQHCAAALRPGEEFLAGIRVEVPTDGRVAKEAAFGVTVGAMLQLREQRREQQAATIPLKGAGGFVGVTAERVLVFESGFGLHPTTLVGAVDRAGLTLSAEVFRSGLVKKASVRLLDGDRTVLDAVCSAGNPDLATIKGLIPAAG